MSLSAKILPFPSRPGVAWLSPQEAELEALDYLAIRFDERTNADRERFLSNPDILLSLCAVLRRDAAPAVVERETREIYEWIARPGFSLGVFDERDYALGEFALLASGASRVLGKREEALLWLDRAEAGFRHTMNPAPGLANVAYSRLALRFEMGRYQHVLELAPSLESSFRKLRMEVEGAKCALLLAMTLKQTGENLRAIESLTELHEIPALRADAPLRARILSELGDLRQLEGQLDLAMTAFQKALALLEDRDVCAARADLKLYVGGVHRAMGSLEEAKLAFRAAQGDYHALEMRGQVAYTHLVIAETLLEMRRDREAEWEILAALPAIDEIQMVPEAFAAAALLRESVQRRKTDPQALQELRAHLQAS